MDMLQAMHTGHPGSISTIHANSAKDALSRLEIMVGMGAQAISEQALRSLMASAIQIIVHLARLPDGSRKFISLSEVTGVEDNEIRLSDVFIFEQEGMDDNGRIFGCFRSTGVPSRFVDHIRRSGYDPGRNLFDFTYPVGRGK